MKQYFQDSKEELKRVDHLIYVSLKYTRTVDVLKNVLERMINFYEIMINGKLEEFKEERKIDEVPAQPVKKCEQLLTLTQNDVQRNAQFKEVIKNYLRFRKLLRSDFDSINEYRRHVAFIAHTDDEGDVEIHIDFVTDHYKFMQTLLEELVKVDEQE
ncbi:hypothetical protein HZA96_01725 [Candidatus Woesearchaeota archaeon]|nr:hypothetical protein [Candidatus Woesearchaeota archaeon]